jgi:hypothetical protein
MRHIGCFETREGVGELCYTRDGGDGNLARQDYPMSCVSLGRIDYSLHICYCYYLGNLSYPCYIYFYALRSRPLKAAYGW